jgi:hypothetical protein
VGGVMRRIHYVTGLALLLGLGVLDWSAILRAQEAKSSGDKAQPSAPTANANAARAISGMYSFVKDGEFVQVTVEDTGHVTGFVSRFGNGESDKGAFLDQFFKSAKLEANKLSFTTEIVHGVSFGFQGTVERGEGKNPGDESYFVLRGLLTENASDANGKVTSHSRDVLFKIFPQDATPVPSARK